MKLPQPFPTFLAVALLSAALSPAHSQDVRTYRYNNARTGLNAMETILTPSNVNVDSFGKLFALALDGKVDAQPLYLSAVTISGGTHNVLIVVTENDSVYAFDADTGAQYWKISALKSGETPSDDRGCDQVYPQIGITATPAISRPSGSNGVIYLVAMSKDSSGNYYQRLHALNAATGGELYNGPVAISAKYPGTGDNSSGGYVIFDPAQYKERSGLLLSNGAVYLTWASHCDLRPYTGWIMAYNTSNLAQTSVLNITPNGNEGAIWGSGAGLTMDTLGNIFLLDANGVFDTNLSPSGFPSSGDYGNAFLHLSTKSGLAVADYFEAYNNENDGDVDLGSGGALLLPNLKDSSGVTWQLAAGAGKDGNLYLVNRASMGKYTSGANNIYQQLPNSLPGGMWNSPAYFAGKLYYGPVGSPILAFQFQNAKLLTSPVAKSASNFAFPGATLTISANNTTDAIVWAVENASSGAAVLHAYSATNLTELYNTTQASSGRDSFGTANKYAAAIVAHGKVYVPTTNGVAVLGLLTTK
jgi:putative pyrroloquinoline-quinone binding quinoprotein